MSKLPAPTSLRIPPDLKRDLKRFAPLEQADVERRSMTWLILRILRQWVDWKKKNPPTVDKR